MTAIIPLPYLFDFNFADGTPWPYWQVPAPFDTASNPADVHGGRGRIQLNNNGGTSSQFSGYLPTADADSYDLRFDFDLSEIVPMLTGDLPYIYLNVQLEDMAVGANYYTIYLDPNGLSVTTYQYYDQSSGPYAAAVATVNLTSIDTSQPMSVRVEESPNSRLFKVWQGTEPAEWTVSDTSAHTHAGARQVYLYVFARYHGSPSLYVDNLSVSGGEPDWYWEPVGSTTHFNFWYDSSLGAQGAIDANQEMAYIEDDLLNHFRWFGNTAPWVNGPAKVDVKYYNDSHSPNPIAAGVLAWYEPSEHTIYINWAEPRQNGELSTLPMERAIIVHELVHHFQDMTFLGGYMREQSFQEAHAAFLERQFRAVIDPFELREGGYAGYVGEFINSTRPNYVTQSYTGSGPQLELAIGCQLLFLNWLRYQKGYSAAAITQSQSPVKWGTPQSVYAALTGDFLIDPSVKFFAELEQAFPVGTTVDTSNWPDIANPYPLGVPSANGSGGAALGGAIFGTAKGGLKGFPHPR